MASGSFVDEPIGYRAFKDAYDTLLAHGYIQAVPGKKGGFGGVGTATRLRATGKLIELAASYGINLCNLSDHFGSAPPPRAISQPVVMRAPAIKKGKERHQGKKLKLSHSHPGIVSDTRRINSLNSFLSTAAITGAERWALQRVYCDTGDSAKYARYGGRFYSPFQNMEKEDRYGICISGEPTCEIDISSSFLTIYHSLVGEPLNTSLDNYGTIPVPRPIAKAYINAAFGHGQFHKHWPTEVVNGLENPEDEAAERFVDVKRNYPALRMRMAVEARFPALARMEAEGVSWGDLHYEESEVILATMEALAFDHGVASLPIHDAIIVPVSQATLAAGILSKAFEGRLGVKPKLTFKNLEKEQQKAA